MKVETISSLEKISDGIYVAYGEGFCSNLYILRDGNRAMLIDSGSGSTIPQIDEALLGLDLDCVILTHGHADHIMGMNHISADGHLHKHDLDQLDKLNQYMPNFSAPSNIDELTYESYRFGKFDLQLLHTPGHTQGSISIFDKTTRLLFSGDTLFAGGAVGRTDLAGGDSGKLKESVKLLKKINYWKLCPGHGPIE